MKNITAMGKASGGTRTSSASGVSSTPRLPSATIASYNKQERNIRQAILNTMSNLVDKSNKYSEEAYNDISSYIAYEINRLPKEELTTLTTFEEADKYLHTVMSVSSAFGRLRASAAEETSYDAIKYLHGKGLARRKGLANEKFRMGTLLRENLQQLHHLTNNYIRTMRTNDPDGYDKFIEKKYERK